MQTRQRMFHGTRRRGGACTPSNTSQIRPSIATGIVWMAVVYLAALPPNSLVARRAISSSLKTAIRMAVGPSSRYSGPDTVLGRAEQGLGVRVVVADPRAAV